MALYWSIKYIHFHVEVPEGKVYVGEFLYIVPHPSARVVQLSFILISSCCHSAGDPVIFQIVTHDDNHDIMYKSVVSAFGAVAYVVFIFTLGAIVAGFIHDNTPFPATSTNVPHACATPVGRVIVYVVPVAHDCIVTLLLFEALNSVILPTPAEGLPIWTLPVNATVPTTSRVLVGAVLLMPTLPPTTERVSVNDPLVPYPIPTRVDDEYVMIWRTFDCTPSPYPVPDPLSNKAIRPPVVAPIERAQEGVFVPIPRRLFTSSQKRFALSCEYTPPAPAKTTDPCVNTVLVPVPPCPGSTGIST